jgi:transposase InsO family protein
VEAAQAAADALEPRRRMRRKTRQLAAPDEQALRRASFTLEQRLLVLDAWARSGLTGAQMADLVGLSPHTLYGWRKRFEHRGPAGLEDRQRGPKKGSRLPEPTQRAILLLKRQHPDWGSERIADVLARADGYAASPGAIVRLLKKEGYETVEVPTRPHPDKPRRFERARVNALWQSDLFSFTLKRSGRRLHLVAFLDDRSRYVVGWGLSASSSSKMVLEAFESAIANYGAPEEVLTDQGPQYATWRGKSAFAKLCERRGIKHILARPRHPQTVGKTERFWGTMWRECLQGAVCRDLEDARGRIGHFVDYYNFQRTHRALDGLVPADRFFEADETVRAALEKRVAQNALDLARHGTPRKPFYLTGRVGDRDVSIFAEGERVVLSEPGEEREEVDLGAPGRRRDRSRDESADEDATAPGSSPFDGWVRRLGRALGRGEQGAEPPAAETPEQDEEAQP